MLSLSSVVVGFLFSLPLLLLHFVVIKNGDDTSQELDLLQFQFLHAVFESIPEVILRSISLANNEKNVWDIASLVLSILFIVVIAAKFYSNPRNRKDAIKIFGTGLNFGMVVTLMLLIMNSMIGLHVIEHWLWYWISVIGYLAAFLIGLLFFIVMILLHIRNVLQGISQNSSFWDSDPWNKWCDEYLWSLKLVMLLSTAFLVSDSIETGKNMVFVSLFMVAVILHVIVATGSFTTGSDWRKSVKYALVTIAAFAVVVGYICLSSRVPKYTEGFVAYIVGLASLVVIESWSLLKLQQTS